MKKVPICWSALAILLVLPLHAETPKLTPLSLSISPALSVPLGGDAALYTLGGAASIGADYRMPFLPLLFAGAGLRYSYVPLQSVTTLSIIDGSLRAGVRYDPLPQLSLRAYAIGGYYYAFLNNGSPPPAANPLVGGGISLSWAFLPLLSLELGGEYRAFLGLSNDAAVSLGLSYSIPVAGASAPRPQSVRPGLLGTEFVENPGVEGKGLVIRDVTFGKVFPILHAWYDKNPVGSLRLKNTGTSPATDVMVTLYIRQYMDAPKPSAKIAEIKPGQEEVVDLLALFKGTILEITQTTPVPAEVSVEYTQGGETAKLGRIVTVDVYDRNAMTWDDTRKAAAFVTPKEPVVLFFSNNVNAMVREKMNRVIDKKLQTAMALHEALRQYGIGYVSPPLTSYAEKSKNTTVVDSLKFPRDTIAQRSGDCSDLAILYCALLESVQIETAFITTPGHIFMAFALDLSGEEARATFPQLGELIFTEGKVWVPVEVTVRTGDFLAAWQEGAKEWRENLAAKKAEFWPVREAWNTYGAVFFPGTGSQPELPKADRLAADLRDDVSRLVTREIAAKESTLKGAIEKSGGSPASQNALGVLYARFDLRDKAEAQFQKALGKGEYVPALVNLGNIAYLKGDYRKALGYYNRAAAKAPNDATVVLAVARANHELQNYGAVKDQLAALKKLDPQLADRFAYLELQGDASTRAAESANVKDVVLWEDPK